MKKKMRRTTTSRRQYANLSGNRHVAGRTNPILTTTVEITSQRRRKRGKIRKKMRSTRFRFAFIVLHSRDDYLYMCLLLLRFHVLWNGLLQVVPPGHFPALHGMTKVKKRKKGTVGKKRGPKNKALMAATTPQHRMGELKRNF